MTRLVHDVVHRLRDLRHDALSTPEVLGLRVLGLAWLLTGHVGLVAEPTRWWPDWPEPVRLAWSSMWILGQLVATVWLLVARRVQLAAFTLSALLMVGFALSRPYHANNRLFFASALLCAALTPVAARLRPLRVQSALLFLGAAIDKIFNADWVDGVFLRALADHQAHFGTLWAPGNVVGLPNHLAQWLIGGPADAAWVWQGLSVATIALELAAGVLVLALPRHAPVVIVPLMTGIAAFGGSTMGMFVYVGLAGALVVLPESGPDTVTLFQRPVRVGAVLAAWALACGPWTHGTLLVLASVGLGALALWATTTRPKLTR